jgi:sterol desaturase/sphingolipid hydroxylase (fatty acid hydroxylase superfamily)
LVPGAFIETYLWLLVPIFLRYLALAAAVHGLFWGSRPPSFATRLATKRPQGHHLWREARTAGLASLIYALPAAVLVHEFKAGGTALTVQTPSSLAGWLWIPGAVLLLMVLQDAYFYWTHRLMHLPRFYRATHHTHHVSKQPSSFASFAFSGWEALVASWFVPFLAFVIPMHVAAFVIFVVIATVQAVMNHAGWEIYPRSFLDGPVGRWLITARHHNLHHTKFSRNYGLFFRFWDRLMGTDDMRGDPMDGVRT